MFKVGVTGGIGSGKTTVTQLFAELGVPILDADVVAHELVAKGQPALKQIQQLFGKNILTTMGELDRRQLRTLIFSDPVQKKRLENLLHPLIYKTLQQQVDALNYPYCLIVIPLLFETQATHFVDRILVVDCPVACQLQRVAARDQQSLALTQAIIDSQISREERCVKADDCIDNSNNPHKPLAEQVKTLHNSYLARSSVVTV